MINEGDEWVDDFVELLQFSFSRGNLVFKQMDAETNLKSKWEKNKKSIIQSFNQLINHSIRNIKNSSERCQDTWSKDPKPTLWSLPIRNSKTSPRLVLPDLTYVYYPHLVYLLITSSPTATARLNSDISVKRDFIFPFKFRFKK